MKREWRYSATNRQIRLHMDAKLSASGPGRYNPSTHYKVGPRAGTDAVGRQNAVSAGNNMPTDGSCSTRNNAVILIVWRIFCHDLYTHYVAQWKQHRWLRQLQARGFAPSVLNPFPLYTISVLSQTVHYNTPTATNAFISLSQVRYVTIIVVARLRIPKALGSFFSTKTRKWVKCFVTFLSLYMKINQMTPWPALPTIFPVLYSPILPSIDTARPEKANSQQCADRNIKSSYAVSQHL